MLVKKELTKVGLCSLIGLIVGLVLALQSDDWSSLLMMPLYITGIVYAFQYVAKALTAIFAWFANLIGISIASFNCCGFGFGLLILAGLVSVVLSFVWIVGLILALRSLFSAFQQDRELGGGLPAQRSKRRLPQGDFDLEDDNPFGGSSGSRSRKSNPDDMWDL